MPVMTIETYDSLVEARDVLLAAGVTASNPILAGIIAKIDKAGGIETKKWLSKVKELGALLVEKVRRANSKEDGEASYDAGKVLYDLTAIRVMLDAVIAEGTAADL